MSPGAAKISRDPQQARPLDRTEADAALDQPGAMGVSEIAALPCETPTPETRRDHASRRWLAVCLGLLTVLAAAVFVWTLTAPHRRERAMASASISELQEQTRQEPSNARVWYWLGRQELHSGAAAAAADHLSQATALAPDSEDIWLRAAYAADLAGDQGRALKMSENFVRRHPESVKAQFALAKLFHRLNFPGNAYVHIKPVVKAEPENVKAWYLYGLAARWAQRPQEALDAFTNAARLDPQNADIQVDLAASQSDMSQYEAAEKTYRRALALRPGDRKVRSLFAAFLLEKRDDFPALRREAAQILRALVAESPRNSFALYRLGAIALKENKPAEAVTLLQAALRQEPERDIGWTALGRAYQRLGKRPEAEAALAKGKNIRERAIRAQKLIDAAGDAPNDLSLHLRLARYYATREDSTSASLNEYLICHRIAPKDAAVKAELEAFSDHLRQIGKMPSLDFLSALADVTAADVHAYRSQQQTR